MKFLRSFFSRKPSKSPLYIDASSFDPLQEQREEALILFAQNEAGCIGEQVSAALRNVGCVVVIDQDSSDGTAYLAAEAGAVVVMQAAGQTREAALQEALRVGRRIARKVRVGYELPV